MTLAMTASMCSMSSSTIRSDASASSNSTGRPLCTRVVASVEMVGETFPKELLPPQLGIPGEDLPELQESGVPRMDAVAADELAHRVVCIARQPSFPK